MRNAISFLSLWGLCRQVFLYTLNVSRICNPITYLENFVICMIRFSLISGFFAIIIKHSDINDALCLYDLIRNKHGRIDLSLNFPITRFMRDL